MSNEKEQQEIKKTLKKAFDLSHTVCCIEDMTDRYDITDENISDANQLTGQLDRCMEYVGYDGFEDELQSAYDTACYLMWSLDKFDIGEDESQKLCYYTG